MSDLYDITVAEALKGSINAVIENNPGMSKKQARQLVLNALIYNCVIEEVVGQAEFLLGKEV